MPRILAGNVEDWKGTRRKLRKAHWLTMSGLGQKQTSNSECSMPALPPEADIHRQPFDVRFVPQPAHAPAA
jgi:hypothetical protein